MRFRVYVAANRTQSVPPLTHSVVEIRWAGAAYLGLRGSYSDDSDSVAWEYTVKRIVGIIRRISLRHRKGLGGERSERRLEVQQQSRREFLSDKSHRIRFVYTPKHGALLCK